LIFLLIYIFLALENINMFKGAGADTVNVTRTPFLNNTRFTEYLIQKNALDQDGFQGWAFCIGMLFQSTDKWWGDQKKRDKPHEGLDLCLYKNQDGTIVRLEEKAKVPVIYDGMVVGIIDDFLGKSIIVEHLFADGNNNRLCTIYGHTTLQDHLHVGKTVKQGDIIATLADSSRFKINILPHLHISLGWVPESIPYDRLDWKNLGDPNTVALMDPMQIIDWHYFILTHTHRDNAVK
jgi:murein DD-endopeptidase MepM/ murein hydrolase activator NlpD